MPVDLLHCVSPLAIKVLENGHRQSDLAKSFEAKTWDHWDAVDPETRRTFPRSASSLRIVQYESCRGLEGWTTVLDGLDDFWDLKRSAILSNEGAVSGLVDPELHAQAVAWRWCMIPLTRPIDTLVITLRNETSHLAQVISSVAARMPDIVETIY